MLTLLSPSKKLDEKTPYPELDFTYPVFSDETKMLVHLMKEKSQEDIQQLMKLSDALSALNFERYRAFSFPLTKENSRPAFYTFKGDVYSKIDVETYSEDDLMFAQQHVRILSGLYGILKPLDFMHPYRLEMGTALKNPKGKDLYDFWKKSLTEYLESYPYKTLINLASVEYIKALDLEKLSQEKHIITIDFKHLKNGELKTIALHAKRARGLMANYIIRHRIDNPEKLKYFAEEGYVYVAESSTPHRYVFVLDTDK